MSQVSPPSSIFMIKWWLLVAVRSPSRICLSTAILLSWYVEKILEITYGVSLRNHDQQPSLRWL